MPTTTPFNIDAVSARQIEQDPAPDGETVRYRVPSVTLEKGRPLRLNSGQLDFATPPPLSEMPRVADQMDFLRRHFQGQCGLWAKPAQRFVGSYFDLIQREIDAHRAELADRLAPFGTLYEPDQWAFSALRPLPRAHLDAAETRAAKPPDSLVRTDIAFWAADGALAVEFTGYASPSAADIRRRSRLADAGIEVIDIPRDALESAVPDDLAACLPAAFFGFWRTETLPAGPFRASETPAELPL